MNSARHFPLARNAGAGIRLLVAAVLGLASFTVVPAQAQDVEPMTVKPLAVRLGAFFPTQGTLRNESSTPYFAAGVDYNPNFRFRPVNGSIYFSADVQFRDNGSSFLIVPLTANIVWPLISNTQYRVYAGIGGGIYFINVANIGGTTQAGARFILGADIGRNWFGEVDYQYVSGFSDNAGNGIRVDGLSFYLGRRF